MIPLMSMRVERIVDLSVILDEGTQVFPGDSRPELSVATRIEREGYNVLSLRLGSQSGTHVDAPYHFIEGGPRLEECDLGLFVGPGLLVDLRGHRDRQPITWRDIAPCEETIRPGIMMVLQTGWSDRYLGTDRYYDHPFLDADACARLVERGVRTLGIDAPNVDETAAEGAEPRFPCHLRFLGAGGVFAENLTNLGAVDFADPLVCLLPIRLGGNADGAPCRAIALKVATA